jgi:hemoglobin
MSLYTELGGQNAIKVALDRFYERVMADPRVSTFFEGVDVNQVKSHQKEFLCMVFGGPSNYNGRDLRSAHARPRARGLNDEKFDIFMNHFRTTLKDLGVEDTKVTEVMSIAYGGKGEVLDR